LRASSVQRSTRLKPSPHLAHVDNRVAFSDIIVDIIATRTDVDFLRLNASAAGTLAVTVNPWFSAVNTNGNNLDVELLVFNSAGTLIGSHSPNDVARLLA